MVLKPKIALTSNTEIYCLGLIFKTLFTKNSYLYMETFMSLHKDSYICLNKRSISILN